MTRQVVLIGLDGKEVTRLPLPPKTDAWIAHDGKWYGFGVAKLDGDYHYYRVDPDPVPMGNPHDTLRHHVTGAIERGEKQAIVGQPAIDHHDRNAVIAEIRRALKARSGKQWSVTGGRGTAWGWIGIDAPPSRLVDGHISEEDRKQLAELLGLESVHVQGISIPAGSDYRREYLDRANGRKPSKVGQPYWD